MIADAVTAAVGLVLAFFGNGYLLLRATLPSRLDRTTTFLLAVPLSVAMTIVVGAGLGFAGAFTRTNVVVALVLVAVVSGGVAWWRGGLRLPQA